jgi:hypothetical protein
MNVWEKAEEMHKEMGAPYAERLSYYMHNGYVFSTPNGMIWAEPHITKDGGSWLVYLLIGSGTIPLFLNAMPFWLPNFSFARLLRQKHNIRTYSTSRLCKLYAIDPKTLQAR